MDLSNYILCTPTMEERDGILRHLNHPLDFHIHVTGMGPTLTAYYVLKIITNHPGKTIVHLGISGAFDQNLQPGDLVRVRSEMLADFGAEDGDGDLISFFDLLPSIDGNTSPWVDRQLVNTTPALGSLPEVKSLTVPFASGQQKTIDRRKQLNCSIENMEGLGLFYTCLSEGVPFHSIRAVSNYVEVRNKSKWEFDLCFRNLAEWVINV